MLVLSQLKKFLPDVPAIAPLALCCAAACGGAPATPQPAMPQIDISQAATVSAAMDVGVLPHDGVCEMNGTWALRVQLEVEWDGSLAMEGGSGVITQYARVERHQDADGYNLTEVIQPCGVVVPPLRRTGIRERHLFAFNTATFDAAQENIQATRINSNYLEGFVPNGAFHSDFAALQLGVALDNPVSDLWPRGQNWRNILPRAVQVDSAAKQRGMPSCALKKNGFVRPLLAMFPGGGRLKQAYFAVRNVERITAQHLGCDRAEGTAEVRMMDDGSHAMDLALVDCTKDNGEDCSDADINNFNHYLPQMRPVAGRSSVVLVRAEPGVTCQEITKSRAFMPVEG